VEHREPIGFRALFRELLKNPESKLGSFNTLKRCLDQWRREGLVIRSELHRYAISKAGLYALTTSEDLKTLQEVKITHYQEIKPDPEKKTPPNVLPINASVYIDPEIKLSEYLFEDTISYVAGIFEILFEEWFVNNAVDQLAHKIQQMRPQERMRFLRRLILFPPNTTSRRREAILKEEEDRNLNHKPSGSPPLLRFEDMLNFQGALVVSISKEKLRGDPENMRKRFVSTLLERFIGKDLVTVNPRLLPAMADLGLITAEEYKEYLQARTYDRRLKIIHELRAKYQPSSLQD